MRRIDAEDLNMVRKSTNRMTELLVAALNNRKGNFRNWMLNRFGCLFETSFPTDVEFYVYQSLMYEELNGLEMGIIALVPGKRTPVLMIELKTDYWEPLHESQMEDGAYDITSKKHGIPLLYIIPSSYTQRDKIPARAGILDWNDILGVAWEYDNTCFAEQIERYIDIFEEDAPFSKEEVALLTVPSLMKEMHQTENLILEEVEQILKKHGREFEFGKYSLEPHGKGYNYNYDGNDLFIGFNRSKDAPFFALCIKESANTDNDGKLYYEDGYYYVPIEDSDCVEGDEEVLTDLRKFLKKKNVVISRTFEKTFHIMPRLRSKLSRLDACYSSNEVIFLIKMLSDDDHRLILGGEYSIALGIHKDILDKEKCTDLLETDDYYEFPFCKYTRLFCDFLLSSTDKELQKNYDLLLDTVLKEADKRRK